MGLHLCVVREDGHQWLHTGWDKVTKIQTKEEKHFLLGQPGAPLQEPVFLFCIINEHSEKLCLFTKALSGKACCHLTYHGGFYFLLKNGDLKPTPAEKTYLL